MSRVLTEKKKKWISIAIIVSIVSIILIMSSMNGYRSSALSEYVTKVLMNELVGVHRPDTIFEAVNGLVRKLAHLLLYSFSAGMTFLLIYGISKKLSRSSFYSIVLCIVVAIVDEINQSMIIGRTGSVKDVIIDSIGIISGIVFVTFVAMVVKRIDKGQ